MSSNQHSVLPPSGAAVWSRCPGSVMLGMETRMPWSESGEAAEEGRQAHTIAERWARGDTTPSGDADMDRGAQLWADTLADMAPLAEWRLEEQVTAPSIHPMVWGTTDGRHYSREHGLLRVGDYKYGFKPVEPESNLQLICYAAGVLDALGINGYEDQHTRVELFIVQPRASHRDGPVRRWSVLASELRPYINQLAAAAGRAMSPGATVHAGEQCQYCPARYACPAARDAAGSAADYAQAARPDYLTPDALAYEVEALRQAQDAIKYRLTGLEAQAVETIKQGATVPGWTIEPGQGRRTWSRPVEEVRRLGELYGVPLTREEPITPTQAIDAGVDKGVILSYSEVPKRAHKLVKAQQTRAAKAFSK